MARPYSGVVCEAGANACKRVGEQATFNVAELVEPNRLLRPYEGCGDNITLLVAEVVEIRPSANPQPGELAAGSPPVRHYLFREYPDLILQEKHILN